VEIYLLFLLLQIKHWYADFKIQTYMQTVKKGVWLDSIGMSHSVDHIWCSLVAFLIFSFFYTISLPTVIVVCLVEGLVHYMIDYIKVKYGSKDNTKPLYWNQFGLDQLAHQSCYILMTYIIITA
jgi:hypothetical protein